MRRAAAGSLASDVQADPAWSSPQADHVAGPLPLDDARDVAADGGHDAGILVGVAVAVVRETSGATAGARRRDES